MATPHASASGYRVEHRGPGGARLLCRGVAHVASLVRSLEDAGERGEVVVVDEKTGRLVARRELAPGDPRQERARQAAEQRRQTVGRRLASRGGDPADPGIDPTAAAHRNWRRPPHGRGPSPRPALGLTLAARHFGEERSAS